MNSAQTHAIQAAHLLGNGAAQVFKSAHAKVCLGKWLYVTATDELVKHFSTPFRPVFRSDLVPGKLVLELVPDEKRGRLFSPLKANLKRAQFKPRAVENGGETFPKFGITQPDSVIIARDGVLRITLPAKRPPLQERPRRMKGPGPNKPVRTAPKESLTSQESRQADFVPMRPPPNVEVMPQRDTMVSYTKSGARIVVGRKLAQHMEHHSYGLTIVKFLPGIDGGPDQVVFSVERGAGNYHVGTHYRDGFRQICLQNPAKKVGAVPYFGPTAATEVLSHDEGKKITVIVTAPFNAVGARSGGRVSTKSRATPAPKQEQPVAQTAIVNQQEPLSLLKHLVSGVNNLVSQLKESGENVTLRVKEDGALGFTYEA